MQDIIHKGDSPKQPKTLYLFLSILLCLIKERLIEIDEALKIN